MDLVRSVLKLAADPTQTKWVCPLLLLGDAVLTALVVWKVPYTKIDWDAYMQQVALYVAGERDYAKIQGETGPLVYPAMHVYIYRLLYAVTDQGRDIFAAQCIFAVLYMLTLSLVMSCYRQAKVPPYVFPLLILSKRLHSIFVLRLFNDCFAVFFLFLAIYCYQHRAYTIGTLMYTLGLGVKMSLLLALPAIGLVLWQGMGRDRAFYQAQSIGQLQTVIAYPFIATNLRNYVARAFELTRQFLFKWTVNWRFLGEERFLSRSFSIVLISIHVALLAVFTLTRWLRPANVNLSQAVRDFFQPPPKDVQVRIARRVTPDFVLTTILSAVIIGCLCARSLHYQFYVYIAWSTPFLLWKSQMHPIWMYIFWAAQEVAWNIYPSTSTSSLVVVHSLGLAVFGVWVGTSAQMPKKAIKAEAAHQE